MTIQTSSDRQSSQLNELDKDAQSQGLYIGSVISINDPQQQGRVKVYVHGIHDPGRDKETYPWAYVAQGLAGVLEDVPMGPEGEEVTGITSYGNFSVPRPGSTVLVLFAYGRLSSPIVVGCLHLNNLMSSLPGGNKAQNEKTFPNDAQANITRLFSRLDEAFGSSETEIKATRGFEVTAAAHTPSALVTGGGSPDVPEADRKTGDITQDRTKTGYPLGVEYDIPAEEAPDLQTPMMYSWTTPAQNVLLMNDDPDNFRIRLRTLSGNQVILDDTNQRIYISTGRGENYIEMDEDGHIDIFANHRISIHGTQDINIKSDKQVNIEGVEGINLKADKDIKVESGESISIKAGTSIYEGAGANIHQNAATDIFHEAGTDIHHTAGADMHHTAGTDINHTAGTDILQDAGADIHQNAGDSIYETAASSIHLDAGDNIHLTAGSNMNFESTTDTLFTTILPGVLHFNGPAAVAATVAEVATAATAASDPVAANTPNRKPLKETSDWRSISPAPTARRSDSASLAHTDKSTVDVYENRTEGGKNSITRPLNWRK
jgi:hypothetical protein